MAAEILLIKKDVVLPAQGGDRRSQICADAKAGFFEKDSSGQPEMLPNNQPKE